MKAFLVLVLVLACLSAVNGEGILNAEFSFEIGYLPQNGWILHESDFTINNNFYGLFSTRLFLFDLVFVGGSVRCNFSSTDDSTEFFPSDDWYGFTAGIKIQGFEAGIRHQCFHPVMPYVYSHGTGTTNIEGSYTEIYLKFSGKINLF